MIAVSTNLYSIQYIRIHCNHWYVFADQNNSAHSDAFYVMLDFNEVIFFMEDTAPISSSSPSCSERTLFVFVFFFRTCLLLNRLICHRRLAMRSEKPKVNTIPATIVNPRYRFSFAYIHVMQKHCSMRQRLE